ncbi:DUF4174 domain-containing protein [Amaricoccus tamworthensis]|uniref:DUF4174 domain-containing protein n=1 Tax=Amaricoccus tamworthensis TaxID=57002 RepID=UPI003C7A0857
MRVIRSIVTIGLAVVALGANAQTAIDQGSEDSGIIAIGEPPALEDLLWVARPVVVFADTPNDPRFAQQMEMLQERQEDLADRDVIVLVDTDPDAKGPLRLKLRPRGFGLVLIDKDGTVAKRRPAPTTSRELINLIDRMPSRHQETGSFRQ